MSEPIIVALAAALNAGLPCDVHRNASLPETVGPNGFASLGDGAPGEPVDIALSPITYSYAHSMPLDLAVQASDNDAALKILKDAVNTTILSDRTLGGLCEWIEIYPDEAAAGAFPGAASVKFQIVNLVVHYQTANPLS